MGVWELGGADRGSTNMRGLGTAGREAGMEGLRREAQVCGGWAGLASLGA